MDILITEDLQSSHIDALAARLAVVREPALWKDTAKLKAALAEARAVMVRNQTQLTAEVLAAAPKLQAIGRVGVGLDNIDVPTATARGVTVIAPLAANAVSVAELTLGLMLALARKIPFSDRGTKAGGWDRRAGTGREVSGKTLVICGFGRIGRLVAARARAFHLDVVAYDPYMPADAPMPPDSGIRLAATLEEALAAGDYVSVHLPLTAETKHLFNAARFARMKPGACFINTSRGGVVDEAALLAALESGHLAGAALDVREVEPPKEPGPLAQRDDVILLPHVGAFTVEAQDRTFAAVCGDVARVLTGQAAVDAVNAPVARGH
jgi:D-3-phosphoglycerate dehydrogenase